MKVWNTLRTTYKVSDFLAWQRDGSLELNPNFQRRSVWKTGAKSYLIDTIARGLPIPIIFLRDRKSNLRTLSPIRDVIDGQQRLRTVISFVAPHLLKNFDASRDSFTIAKNHNAELHGKRFSELDETARTQILDYQFTVNVFPSDTDDREVLQIFARMNSSGYKLNAQELRNANYFGEFKTVSELLSSEQLQRWRDWDVFTADDIARMNEVELTSELIMAMLNGISGRSEKAINKAYGDYDDGFPQQTEVKRRFRMAFDCLNDAFGSHIQELFSRRAVFYPFFCAVYESQYGLQSPLSKSKPTALTSIQINRIISQAKRIRSQSAPKEVLDATTRRGTNPAERKLLFRYLST